MADLIVVVSDTSPIRTLHHLDLLSLLRAQFGRIMVPTAALNELENPGPSFARIDASILSFAEFLAPNDQQLHSNLRQQLDAGEAAAIALAAETPTSRILIDEAFGRQVAEELGLEALGTIRVLLDAKKMGLVDEVTPLLDRLVQEMSFYLSPSVLLNARRLAAEA